MRNTSEHIAQQLLDEVGGESLEGSGFEDEIPDPSTDATNPNPPAGERGRSGTKKERRNVQ